MSDHLPDARSAAVPAGFQPFSFSTGFARQIGPLYEREEADGGYRRGFRVEDYHCNGMGNCHGGMLTAFADVAFGHAITLGFRRYWVTVRLLTDFVSAAKLGDWVEGTGIITGGEDDFVTVKGRIWCGDRTIMSGTGVFKVLGERP